MIMPFGKHKGKNLAEIPMGYFGWLLEESTIPLKNPLRSNILNEMAERVQRLQDKEIKSRITWENWHDIH